MSTPIQILIAEPFASQRRLIEAAIVTQNDMLVCASAENGRAAVEAFRSAPVDVVILNVNLTLFDCPQTVKAIREINPYVPIILFSTGMVRDSEVTLKALSAGANDFVARPAHAAGANFQTFLEQDFLSTVRTWHTRTSFRGINVQALDRLRSQLNSVRSGNPKPAAASSAQSPTATPSNTPAVHAGSLGLHRPPQAIVIGSSTGGPNALCDLLSKLQAPLSAPLLIVQHMPPKFTKFLADRLTSKTPLTVREAEHGDVLTSGTALVAPGGKHMVLVKNGAKVVVQLNEEPPINSCRPSVDVMFESAAEIYRSRTLGVVLTGMGSDGTVGCRHIKEAGGSVITQDRDSCVVWGMPRSVEEAGLADFVAPPDQIAASIQKVTLSAGVIRSKKQLANASA